MMSSRFVECEDSIEDNGVNGFSFKGNYEKQPTHRSGALNNRQ
jgi:hypothetical protein